LIKASVSRQREFLADASAVQFTRNPQSIAGALKKIGGFSAGSKMENPAAPEISHTFFSSGVTGFLGTLSATHPPLSDRIRRLEPQWDGTFDHSVRTPEREQVSEPVELSRKDAAARVAAVVVGSAIADAQTAVDRIGNPDKATLIYARALLATLPETIKQAVHEPYGARAVIYALLMDKEHGIRAKQLAHLQYQGDAGVHELSSRLLPEVEALDTRYRLPIIDMALPALKQLSLGQYKLFRRNLLSLIEMDLKIDLFEWSSQRILLRHLDAEFFQHLPVRPRYARLSRVRNECEVVLSMLAHAGDPGGETVQTAFKAASDSLGLTGLKLSPKNSISFSDLDKALENLARLDPVLKPTLLSACANCITVDQRILPAEAELLRAFSASLDCPMPPLQPSL